MSEEGKGNLHVFYAEW